MLGRFQEHCCSFINFATMFESPSNFDRSRYPMREFNNFGRLSTVYPVPADLYLTLIISNEYLCSDRDREDLYYGLL